MKAIIISLFVIIGLYASAQENQLDFYNTSPLMVNPASTGFYKNDAFRVMVNHRELSVSDCKMKNSSFSFDLPIPAKKIGVGIYLNSNSAGPQHLSVINAMFSMSYNTMISDDGNTLSFGLQAGMRKLSLDNSSAEWENMWDDNLGLDISRGAGEEGVFGVNETIHPNFSFGFLWQANEKWEKIHPSIGFSVYNMSNPDESLLREFSRENRLTMRYSITTETDIDLSESAQLNTVFLLSRQGSVLPFRYAVGATIKLKNSESNKIIMPGLYCKYNKSISLLLGYEIGNCTIILNYEMNIANRITSRMGALNGMGITCIFKKKTNHNY